MKKNVLFLTRSDDLHADAVESVLQKHDVSVLRYNFDRIPDVVMPVAFEFNAGSSKVFIDGNELKDVAGVLQRHPYTEFFKEKYPHSEESDLAFARENWNNFIYWLEVRFSQASWINHLFGTWRYDTVGVQLKAASEVSFRVPETLFTDDFEKLKSFSRHHQRFIIKAGYTPGKFHRNMRLLTNIVDIKNIDPKVLTASPCLFQEYIEKEYELRVYVVGDKVFACKIDSQEHASTSVDWRSYAEPLTYTAVELPQTLQDKCIAYMKKSGLLFGAFDLIVPADGNDTVFLECNTQAAWLWIEKATKLPITAAIADRLTSCNPS